MTIANNMTATNLAGVSNNNSSSGNNISNINNNNSLSDLDNYIDSLKNELNIHNNWLTDTYNVRPTLANGLLDTGEYYPGGFHRVFKSKPYLKWLDNYNFHIGKRDNINSLINEANSKRVELMTNIANQKNRYKWESDALKKVGINNPFFMLKNGVLPSGPGVSLGSQSNFKVNKGAADSGLSNGGKGFLKFLFMLLMLLK